MSTAVPRITPRRIDVEVAGRPLPVFRLDLPGVPRGAVILLGEADRLGDQVIELMNGLAEHGYESLAADLGAVAALRDDGAAIAALRQLIDHIGEARDWHGQQIGVVGYGYGGRIALRAAAELDLGAAVSISPAGLSGSHDGRPALTASVRPVDTPWLGMFGALDDDAPAEAVARLRERLTDPSPAYTEIVTYPGVDGDFFHESAEALGHAAMFDSWQRVVEWLNLRVVPRPTPYAEIWSLKQAMSRS
jgi:carboxymethylenebutenolidase